jgi:SAM-dependent methyltransferase
VEPGFATFRDPGGSVFSVGGRIFRATTRAGAETLRAALNTPAVQRMLEIGRLVRTSAVAAEVVESVLGSTAAGRLSTGHTEIFEHERIPFPSYPYEWPPEMLHAAAGLTIDVAWGLLPCGFGLKDATPYNVLFRGPEPVFVDVLSFEPRDPKDPIWLPYGQFVRTFLLPLALSERVALPLDQVFLVRRDGLEPEEAYKWLPKALRIRRPFLSLVSIPVWLSRRQKPDDARVYRPHLMSDPEKARFVLERLLARLRRTVDRLEPSAHRVSTWSGYAEANPYSMEGAAAKVAFVEQALGEFRPRWVLDVGANTGRFSELASAHGASVVAIDRDPVVVGTLWRSARAKGADILPLVVDITRPSPSTGWRNRECASFLERCRGAFDAVLMLALVHHLVVTERIPLAEVVDLAAELATDVVIIEFVGKGDPMFQRLVRGRERLYEDITEAAFEACVRRRFEVVRRQPLEGVERSLYLLRRRAG